MAKSEERLGLSNPPKIPPWKNEPTMISVPHNPKPQPHSAHVARSANPFGKNLNKRRKVPEPGASASGSISMGTPRNFRADEPEPKRRKLEDGRKLRVRADTTVNKHDPFRPHLASRPPLAPDCNEAESESSERNPAEEDFISQYRRSSPDELNLSSQPPSASKYFPRSNAGREGNYRSQLALDGPDTMWAKHHFNVDDSDPIEDATSDSPARFPRTGNVMAKVEMFNQITPSPKIDLTTVQRSYGKASRMKRKFPANQPIPTTSQPKVTGVQPDRLKKSITRSDEDCDFLPVESLFLEHDFYPRQKGQKVELFWTRNSDIIVKVNEAEEYRLHLSPESCQSTLSEPPVIVLQLKAIELVTIKFNTDHPQWDLRQFEKFKKLIARVANMETMKDGQILLELATRDADRSSKPTRMEILENAQQNRKPASLQPAPESRKRKATSITQPTPPPTDTPGPSSVVITTHFLENARPPSLSENKSSGLRRSARNLPPERSRLTDPDELILVYPPGPGAVNITQGDLDRLQPGEFLNDTLIEFGLKLWLKDLEGRNPTLANQIHIFNSFFYKKLNGAKDVNQAFESVRKWTSKFDIFEKKYIIVPINEHLHWYLAIICEPEHTLSRKRPNVRKQTRSSVQTDIMDSTPVINGHDGDDQDEQIATESEAEVERDLKNAFRSSCIIEPGDEESRLPEGDDRPSTVSSRPSNVDVREVSPASSSIYMAVDSTEDANAPRNFVPIGSPRPVAPKTSKGKEKADPEVDIHMVEDDDEEALRAGSPQQTFIFIMDSLGTRHPQAVKKLSKYLALEAKDKKGIEDAGDADGRFASVPVQPNFCDCGVYLLHFAKTFMSNVPYYTKSILSQSKHTANKERQSLWKDHEVAQMRESLARKIKQLSRSWKKERSKEETTPSSDDEVEIVEKKSPKKPVKSQARRIRG